MCNSRNPDPRREEGRVGAAADDTVSPGKFQAPPGKFQALPDKFQAPPGGIFGIIGLNSASKMAGQKLCAGAVLESPTPPNPRAHR